MQYIAQDILHLISYTIKGYTMNRGDNVEFGTVNLKVNEQLKKSGLSKNKFSQRAEMQRTQLNKYLKNEVALLDRSVLARMCTVLNCDISDLLEFVPPNEK